MAIKILFKGTVNESWVGFTPKFACLKNEPVFLNRKYWYLSSVFALENGNFDNEVINSTKRPKLNSNYTHMSRNAHSKNYYCRYMPDFDFQHNLSL